MIEVYGVDHSDPTKDGRVIMYYDQHKQIVDALKEERDQLRAELAAIRAREPVAVVEVEADYWTDGGFHGKSVFRKGKRGCISQEAIRALPIGTKLYTTPQPQPDVQALVEAITKAISYANGRETEWGSRAEIAFGFLHDALATYKGQTK